MCSTAADDAFAALDAALDALATEGSAVGDAAHLDRVRRLTVAANRITALQAAAVRDAECHQSAEHDGLKTMRSWLRTHTRLSGAAVTGLIKQGRAAALLPAVEAAFLAREITADQVDAIAVIAAPENLDRAAAQDIDLAVVERSLLTIATTQPYTRLATEVGHYLARLDPDGREPDPTDQRSLTLVQHPDGMVTGGLTLDQHGGETVMTAVEAYAAKSRCAGDTRTRAQRMADALVQICANALATGDAPRLRNTPAQLVVMIDEADLVDPHTCPGAGTTGTGALISATRARRVACDSQVSRIVFGPGSAPKDLGRTQRVVSPRSAAHSTPATEAASSPAAKPPTGGATPTTSWNGSSTGPPTSTTSACSANATTPRSTTAFASNDNPTADGAPTAPTAPRYRSTRSCSPRDASARPCAVRWQDGGNDVGQLRGHAAPGAGSLLLAARSIRQSIVAGLW